MKTLRLVTLLALMGAPLHLTGCGDDKTTSKPETCGITAPASVEADTLTIAGTAVGDTVTFTVRNTGATAFDELVTLSIEHPVELTAPTALVDLPTDRLTLAPGDSARVKLVLRVERTTSPGRYTWDVSFPSSACSVPVSLTVLDSGARLLGTLEKAWRTKDKDLYASLLADDFRFYFDPDTRASKGLPEFWTKTPDSTGVSHVFSSNEVLDVGIQLTLNDPLPVNQAGRDAWTLVDVLDMYLAVDLKPSPGEQEGVTLLVTDQTQKFYFRKGRSAADTLATSPTANVLYIVEWRDLGPFSTPTRTGFRSPQIQPTSWGSIKALFR